MEIVALGSRLDIGYVAENKAREIGIDIAQLLEKWPTATPHLMVVRPGEDLAYTATTTVVDGVLVWTITNVDTALPGRGEAQIHMIEDETELLGKSDVMDTVIRRCITCTETPDIPEPVRPWLNQLASAINCESSGAVVSVTDASAKGALQLVSHIEPMQSGSGNPSPDNVRVISGWDTISAQRVCKNLFKPFANNTTLNGVTLTAGKDGSFTLNGTATKDFAVTQTPDTPIPAGTYTLSANKSGSGTFSLYCKTSSGTSVGSTATYRAFTTSEPINVFGLWIDNGTVFDNLVLYPQFELGSVSSDYELYQGQTLTATLPETVYGGTLDWTTGVLTVNWKAVDLGGLTWAMKDNIHFYTSGAYKTADGRPGGDMICSHYVTSTATSSAIGQNTLPDKSIWANGWAFSATNLVIKDTSYSDVESFKASLAGVMLAFKTNDTHIIQLTPQQLSLLKGTNNVWSDCGGDTTVAYVADTKLYIDNKIAEVTAALLATGANV